LSRISVGILLEALDRAAGLERDAVVALARVDEHRMQVVAVGDRIGLLELGEEAWVLERNAGDALARERAAHLHRRRSVHVGEHRVLEVERLQRAEYVGPELNAGADLAKLGRLLEHPHREAFQRQRVR
jgi:hypothetical protein